MNAQSEPMVTITDALMKENVREGGPSWNYPQLQALGVRIPLERGWFGRLVGSSVTMSAWEMFKQLGKKKVLSNHKDRLNEAQRKATKFITDRGLGGMQKSVTYLNAVNCARLLRRHYTGIESKFAKNAAQKYVLDWAASPESESGNTFHGDLNITPHFPVAHPTPKPTPKPLPVDKRPIIDPAYNRHVREEFFASQEWRELRYIILRRDAGTCQCCGRTRKEGVIMHVDHIVPVSVKWSRRADPANLQCLCSDCNTGKGNRSSDSWQ